MLDSIQRVLACRDIGPDWLRGELGLFSRQCRSLFEARVKFFLLEVHHLTNQRRADFDANPPPPVRLTRWDGSVVDIPVKPPSMSDLEYALNALRAFTIKTDGRVWFSVFNFKISYPYGYICKAKGSGDDPHGNVEDWERGPYGEQILRVVKSLGDTFKKKENKEDGDK